MNFTNIQFYLSRLVLLLFLASAGRSGYGLSRIPSGQSVQLAVNIYEYRLENEQQSGVFINLTVNRVP